MTERAAHLVDHVFPDVPIRQWVLSLPHRVRYALAWVHERCKQVVGALLREVARHVRDRARAAGLVDPRGGGIAVVQRFDTRVLLVERSGERRTFRVQLKRRICLDELQAPLTSQWREPSQRVRRERRDGERAGRTRARIRSR